LGSTRAAAQVARGGLQVHHFVLHFLRTWHYSSRFYCLDLPRNLSQYELLRRPSLLRVAFYVFSYQLAVLLLDRLCQAFWAFIKKEFLLALLRSNSNWARWGMVPPLLPQLLLKWTSFSIRRQRRAAESAAIIACASLAGPALQHTGTGERS
jgi:hypothetical protein